ncbi:class I SAM-dependent methyltransferase [Thermosulfurimonas sp. F29]|uniref:class I SAM-dependent methyltransferase n=1 Tax=Thermosulfurimonas sp. F29 TaxID=2867247 RepID=UPI001C82F960|nr:class I SAM-dependent methyltransferase [Thermosulfurimonas sp. F29]MBX6424245.1 class I SAM-dependent methyltransferase [Thermosulfurimonas sp. F29]
MENIKSDIKQIHEEIAPRYGLIPPEGTSCKWAHFLFRYTVIEKFQNIFKKINVSPGAHILEIGCGNGQVAIAFNNYHIIYSGLDFSYKMLLHAQKRLTFLNIPAYHLILGDAEKLPFTSGCFDFVFFYGVMEHLDDPLVVIDEMIRVCKKNGYICLGVPLKNSIAFWTFLFFGISPKKWNNPPLLDLSFREKLKYYRFFSLKKVKKTIAEQFKNQIKLVFEEPICYFYGVGIFELLLKFLFKKLPEEFFYKIDKIFKKCKVAPAGVFLVYQKVEV